MWILQHFTILLLNQKVWSQETVSKRSPCRMQGAQDTLSWKLPKAGFKHTVHGSGSITTVYPLSLPGKPLVSTVPRSCCTCEFHSAKCLTLAYADLKFQTLMLITFSIWLSRKGTRCHVRAEINPRWLRSIWGGVSALGVQRNMVVEWDLGGFSVKYCFFRGGYAGNPCSNDPRFEHYHYPSTHMRLRKFQDNLQIDCIALRI